VADNLGQFRTRVRNYLREQNSDTSFWKDSFLNQLFNAQYRRRCVQLIMTFEGFFIIVASADLTAEQSRYAFPSGFERLSKLELVRTDGRTVPLRRYERHEGANFSSDDVGGGDQYTPTYRLLGNGFVLEPAPNESVTSGIQIEYNGLPALLSADGDQLHASFPEILDELLVLDTVVAAFQAEGAHESGPMAAIYMLRAEWQEDWLRFIDQRAVSRQEVDPFKPHYEDS
jgi:hypothetical protein